MATENTDRRAMLRDAFRSAAAEEEDTTPEVEEAPAEEPAAEEEAKPEKEEAAAPEPEEKPAPEGRDEKGRFAPKAAPKAEAAPKATEPKVEAPKAEAKPEVPPTRAPQSWTPAEREQWAKLTPEAQRAVLRTEQETRRVLQENAQLRRGYGEASQFRQTLDQHLRPYEGIFRAQGMDPVSGALSVVQTYGALHYGAPQQKAAILAQLIGQFSSVDDVNAVLQGQVPAQTQPARPPPQQPQVDPRALVREELQSLQQQMAVSRAEQDFDRFRGTNPEWLDSPGVWENMQAVLDASAQRGRNLTYEQAYDLALKMDPEIQGILQQRAQVQAAVAPSATAPTARARAAAATVRSKPAPAVAAAPDPTDRRAMLQRQMERARS